MTESKITNPDGVDIIGVQLDNQSEPLDLRLFIVVIAVLSLLSLLFVTALALQWQTYHAGIEKALSSPATDDGAVLSYARALDAAFVKTSALFLGYILVFTGALYVLRIATSHYRLGVKSGKYSGTLQTSSPGLVIISLGVLLIAITILTRSDVRYTPPDSFAANDSSRNGTKTFQDSSFTPANPQPSQSFTAPPSERGK
jgi:hypothetical protein